MDPTKPAVPQVVTQPNQYDFIVNYGTNKSSDWLANAPLKTRLIFGVVGAVILLLLIWIGIALFTGGGTTSVDDFTTLAEEQAELIRISQGPATNATAQATQDFATTTQLSLQTDQQAFVAYLASAGTQLSPETLALRKNVQTDEALQAAKAAGTYDQTFITTAQQQLTTYEQGLKQTFNATSNVQERQLLNAAYGHAQLLVTMSSQGE